MLGQGGEDDGLAEARGDGAEDAVGLARQEAAAGLEEEGALCGGGLEGFAWISSIIWVV